MNTKLTNLKLRWNDFYYDLNNQLLTKNLLNLALTALFNERLSTEKLDHFLIIIFKVKMENESIRSISFSQTIPLNRFKELLFIFFEYWNIRSEDYHTFYIKSIFFTYAIGSVGGEIKGPKIIKAIKPLQKEMSFKFSGFNLPNTMDITEWGSVEFYDDYKKAIVLKSNSVSRYEVSIFHNYLEVTLKSGNMTIISWTDTMRDGTNLTSFSRLINKKQEYIFENGVVIVKKIKRLTQFLKPIKPVLFRSEQIITMDLETKSIKKENRDVMIPVCISIYDRKEMKSFYISDFSNKDEMLNSSISYLMKRKYSEHKVYLHNFSYFDAIFLMKNLSSLADKLIPIIRDGRIIDLKFKYGKNNLYFRDSFLLLPSSLANLAINFGVKNKGIFPYNFINSLEQMDYKGNVPSFKYFSNINIDRYNDYCKSFKNRTWNMKEELIKYCEQDVLSLHQIISKFSEEIFRLFRIDIIKYPTLPSLALGIYRLKFLKNHKIPLIDGKIFDDIKEGYTGGAVDVYKPSGENIYRYDVNSLYPSVMKYQAMPVGAPVYFEGDITKVDSEAFGFFEVDVKTPKDLNIPILQLRVKTDKGGIKTMAALGNWRGTHFSEEIKNSLTKGYKFKINRGYLFEKGYIFDEYVDFLYDLKLNSEKGTPNYTISKLLLNSLYGRLGMSPHMESVQIVDEENSFKFTQNNLVSNIINLQNGKIIITYLDEKERYNNRTLNISVPISAAVTSYSRIHMSQFKLMRGINIFYSDTDSIDIDKPLDPKFVGPELGKMKLEQIFKKVVYLAPKVYGGITSKSEYVKIKGLNHPISFDEISSLLVKDSKLEISQDKWYRDMSVGQVSIKKDIYTLIVTDNKRKLIYDLNNKFIGTEPLLLKNGILKKKSS